VTRDDFEHRLLSLWMTTRMPLTRANVQFVTGVPRAKLGKWLDELVADGVLDVDADDDGEMIWGVRGAVRAGTGPSKPEEVKKLGDLKKEVAATAGAASALVKYGGNAARSLLASGEGENKKSMIVSGLLPLFFGPLGWLYAGSLKEAGVAGLIYILACSIIPHLLLIPILTIVNPIAAGVGLLYAWKYNNNGERTAILPSETPPSLPPRR
jgi:hypothetical protein